MKKEDALVKITELVTRFKEQFDSYKKSEYNETLTRRDFIDPFFKALGWDVDNENGYAESYREVIHEDRLKIGTATKAPDYSFRLVGGKRLFFVEAKKPSVQIKDDIVPAYQVRRYGWSAGLPISIITDFEEFAVYDCTIRPKRTDKASVARIRYLTFDEYIQEFEFLWNAFSKEQVLKGSFDKYIKSDLNKKGTSTVDKEFLQSLDTWRTYLAQNVALRNKGLDEEEINYVVQQTINRLIFLRIAEDRRIEPENSLKSSLNQSNYYQNLYNIFVQADAKYNSGLFDFDKDTISRSLVVDDKVIKTIINQLYYPDCDYEFSVMPVEILGSAYEQFLGKVIRVTAGHRVKVEEKPEVRKAGGVYYTPQYIVNYIVENTIGKLLGTRGQGSGTGNNDFNEIDNFKNKFMDSNYEHSQDILPTRSVEGSDESGEDDLRFDNKFTKTRDLRSDESDEESGSINSIEHSGRASKDTHERISAFSLDSSRFISRTGDSSNINSDDELHDERANRVRDTTDDNSGQTTERTYTSTQKQADRKLNRPPIPGPRTPKDVSKIKIVDPACGSGSFLLGAYQYLLDWHKNYYTGEGKISKGLRSDVLTPAGELTTAEKKRILLNNIYGVDIDYNAVEVTKLSLLLKCLEGETEASIEQQIKLFNERVLPDLDNNIKAGNSLIDLDFYDNQMDFEPGVEKKVKPFNWESAFPEVFKQGGFDAVIGNPPYVKEYTDRKAFEDIKKSHLAKYYQGKMDIWYFFMCYGIDLLRKNGRLGFIVPNNWVTNSGASILRNKVINDSKIISLIDFSNFMVFESASIQTMVVVLEKNSNNDNYEIDYRKINTNKPTIELIYDCLLKEHNDSMQYINAIVDKKKLMHTTFTFSNPIKTEILNKLFEKKNFELDPKREVAQGIVTPQDSLNKKGAENLNNQFPVGTGIFIVSNAELQSMDLKDNELEIIKPYYTTEQLHRFYGDKNNTHWLIYTTSNLKSENEIKKYPNIKNHLDKFKKIITSDFKPYGLHRARNDYFFKGEKIISLRKCTLPCFTFTDFDCFVVQTFYVIKTNRVSQKYLTGLLNSKLIAFWLKHKGKMQGTNYQIDKEPILQIPIFVPDLPNDDYNQLLNLVDQMLKLNKDLQAATLPQQIEQLKSRIAYTDKKIDQLVYRLYDLTDDEIRIVESGTGGLGSGVGN